MHDLHPAPSAVAPLAGATGHVAVDDGRLSSHRTAGGTTVYVRCSCGGFIVLVSGRGGWQQLSHAAAPPRC